MKITTIGYGVTKNTGNYENAKVYLEAEVNEGEDFAAAFNELRQLVEAQVNKGREVKDLESRKTSLENDIFEIKRTLQRAKGSWDKAQEKWQEAVQFLQQHGVNTEGLKFPTTPYFSWEGREAMGLSEDSKESVDSESEAVF